MRGTSISAERADSARRGELPLHRHRYRDVGARGPSGHPHSRLPHVRRGRARLPPPDRGPSREAVSVHRRAPFQRRLCPPVVGAAARRGGQLAASGRRRRVHLQLPRPHAGVGAARRHLHRADGDRLLARLHARAARAGHAGDAAPHRQGVLRRAAGRRSLHDSAAGGLEHPAGHVAQHQPAGASCRRCCPISPRARRSPRRTGPGRPISRATIATARWTRSCACGWATT